MACQVLDGGAYFLPCPRCNSSPPEQHIWALCYPNAYSDGPSAVQVRARRVCGFWEGDHDEAGGHLPADYLVEYEAAAIDRDIRQHLQDNIGTLSSIAVLRTHSRFTPILGSATAERTALIARLANEDTQ